MPTHVKRVSQRSAESRGVFAGCFGFLPQGKLTGWVGINTVKKSIITIFVKYKIAKAKL